MKNHNFRKSNIWEREDMVAFLCVTNLEIERESRGLGVIIVFGVGKYKGIPWRAVVDHFDLWYQFKYKLVSLFNL